MKKRNRRGWQDSGRRDTLGRTIFVKHDQHQSITHRTWRQMRSRCNNKRHKFHRYYGGRGISVCQRWASFLNFLSDMGPQPRGMTLERKDNSKGYSPANCRWATRAEQVRNRRNNVLLTFRGFTACLNEWAREVGIPPHTLYYRIRKRGWSVKRALSEPVQTKMRNSLAKIR